MGEGSRRRRMFYHRAYRPPAWAEAAAVVAFAVGAGVTLGDALGLAATSAVVFALCGIYPVAKGSPRRYALELARRGLIEHRWLGWPVRHPCDSIRRVVWEDYRVRVVTEQGEVVFDDHTEHWLELAARLQQKVAEHQGRAVPRPVEAATAATWPGWADREPLVLMLPPSRAHLMADVLTRWSAGQLEETDSSLVALLLSAVWLVSAPLRWFTRHRDHIVADAKGLAIELEGQVTRYPWSTLRRVSQDQGLVRVQTSLGDFCYGDPETAASRELARAIADACHQARRGRVQPAAGEVPDTALSRAAAPDDADAARGVSIVDADA